MKPALWKTKNRGKLTLILLLLVLNVLADHGLIPTDGRDKIPPRPKMLPNKILLALPVHPR